MSALKKPRSDSKLKALLDDDQQLRVIKWLPRMSQEKCLALIEKEFGIKSSTRALSEFWDSVYTPYVLAGRRMATQTADALNKEIAQAPGAWDAPILDKIKHSTFNILNSEGVDPGDVVKLTSLFLEARNQDIKRESLAQAKEKWIADQRTKLETAMEALFTEIKDNPKALAAFNSMKDAIAK